MCDGVGWLVGWLTSLKIKFIIDGLCESLLRLLRANHTSMRSHILIQGRSLKNLVQHYHDLEARMMMMIESNSLSPSFSLSFSKFKKGVIK